MVLEFKVFNESPFKGKKTKLRYSLGVRDELKREKSLLGMRKPIKVG